MKTFDKIKETIESETEELKGLQEIKDGLKEIKEGIKDSLQEGKDMASFYLNGERLRQGQQLAVDQLSYLTDKLEDEIKENPKQTILLSFIVGLVVGRWLLK